MNASSVVESLAIVGLSVRYAGLQAVSGLSMVAPTGRLTGLIGPNGAGKTSTFNAISGFVTPSAGSIELFGCPITDAPPFRRAQRGLGRTFQRMELFDSLTVAENVAMGREALMAGSQPLRHVVGRRSERSVVIKAVQESLEVCGIVDLANKRAGSISTGQRRLVELARVVAGEFRLLLLDEPSSGLDHAETRHLGTVLQKLIAQRGVGILLVEHDMSLVMGVCEYVYVLDFGQLIFEGTPSEVRLSDTVREAYLGFGLEAG